MMRRNFDPSKNQPGKDRGVHEHEHQAENLQPRQVFELRTPNGETPTKQCSKSLKTRILERIIFIGSGIGEDVRRETDRVPAVLSYERETNEVMYERYDMCSGMACWFNT